MIRKLVDYKIGKAECLISKGMVAAKRSLYEQSIQLYLQAIPELEGIKGNRKDVYLSTLYADIASDYYELEQFENSLKYDKLSLHVCKPVG